MEYISRSRASYELLTKMGRGCRSQWLLLQVIGQILLVINQVDSSPADKTIHIGYLLQSMDRAGAINVAIEQAQNDGFLREYNFRYDIEATFEIIKAFISKHFAWRLSFLKGIWKFTVSSCCWWCWYVDCWSIVYIPTDCSAKNGTSATLQILQSDEVDVIFGSVCARGKRRVIPDYKFITLLLFCYSL